MAFRYFWQNTTRSAHRPAIEEGISELVELRDCVLNRPDLHCVLIADLDTEIRRRSAKALAGKERQ